MTKIVGHALYHTTAIPLVLALTMFATPAVAQKASPGAIVPDASVPADQAAATTATPEDEAEAIVVTGIRASLESSARLKRNTPTIIESVSAEDIGKLPDVSIADSLARLPGVTAQRLEGRDQRLSIRGLAPDFSTTLLNGREQVTVGDNRGVEYDQYPSEFFRNVVVHKSANASLVPSGISGTVDLRMLRPLNHRKPIVAVQLRGQLNGQDALNPEADRVGYRASGTYIDQFAEDTIGIAIGLSHTKSVSQNERYNAWGFPNEGSVGGNMILGGAKPYVQSNALTRTGAVGTLEFKPNDRLHTTLDVLYSKFKEVQYLRGIEFPINPGWGAGTTITNFTAEDGLVTEATVNGVVGVVRNDYNRRKADTFSIGLNNVYALTDTLNVTVDGSWSKSNRTDFLLENYSGTGFNMSGARDSIRISANKNGTFDIVPTLDYGNAANLVITDPRGWGNNGTATVVQAGFLNQPKFKDDLKALRASLDGEIAGSFLNRWEVGANYSRRSKDSKYKSFFLCPKDTNPSCTVASGQRTSVPIPSEAIVGTIPLEYLGVPSMIALDPLYLYNNVYDAEFDNRPGSLVRDYNVTEKVLTGYAMLGIEGALGDVPVTGSIGAQIVHTKQSSDGRQANLATIDRVPTVTFGDVTGGKSYTNILPSAAFAFEMAEATYIKTGISKTLVRPRMDQMRVSQDVGINFARLASTDPADSAFSSSGGNPELQPYRSLNFDLSAERYFSKGGYVALTAYYKRLTDFVDPNNATLTDFSALADNLPPALRAQIGTTQGRLSLPDNTGKGWVFGQEATLSLPFANLIPALDGFGFFGSVSHVDSEIKFATSNIPITVPGQSTWVGTAEAYYEKRGFQARMSYRYRSSFLAELAGLSANPEFRTAKAEGILDAQIGYEFQTGSLAGLAIMAQAKNLTDRPFVTHEEGDKRLVREYQRYGRDFYLGISYKF